MHPLITNEAALAWRGAVRAALERDTSCVPDGAVLLTMVDHNQAALRPLQFARVMTMPCLMARVVSLCWNHTDDWGCVHANEAWARSSPPVSVSALYHLFSWAKWNLLLQALSLGASLAVFVDADVLLLRNPFDALRRADTKPSAVDLPSRSICGTREILYQFEGPGSNPLNSGQLVACSANAVESVLSRRPLHFDGSTQIEQEIAYAALRDAGHQIRPLSQVYFGGNCVLCPEVLAAPSLPS